MDMESFSTGAALVQILPLPAEAYTHFSDLESSALLKRDFCVT